MCENYMYYCILPSLLIYITCLGHIRLSGYAWDIFLTYIRRRLSSRLYSNVFWKAGCDTNSSKGETNLHTRVL